MAACALNDAKPALSRLQAQLKDALYAEPQPVSGSRYLNDLPDSLHYLLPDKVTPAAVLLPIIAHEEPTVLLTVRTEHLARHAGQISFPGGHFEACDKSPLDCALRETSEETGIQPAQVEPLGYLDTYITRTGFAVTPVVGWLQPALKLRPDPVEVSEIFEIPLRYILDKDSYLTETRTFEGVDVSFKVLQHGDYRVWGATAAMLYHFRNLLHHG